MGNDEQLDWREAFDRLYVGFQFSKRREELGLDAETVAEEAGYSIFQYTMMEEGKRSITVEDYFRVSNVWYAYEDAQYPAFQRSLRQVWRSIKRQFFMWELQIEIVFPASKGLFDEIPLRLIVLYLVLVGPMLMLLGNQILFGEESVFYHVGYAMGKFCRMISDLMG